MYGWDGPNSVFFIFFLFIQFFYRLKINLYFSYLFSPLRLEYYCHIAHEKIYYNFYVQRYLYGIPLCTELLGL